jgi:hypothetical protein
MTQSTHTTEQVQAKIDELIKKATSYDIESLDHIYHDDLNIIMVDHKDNINIFNKPQFKELFTKKKTAGNDQMNTWVKYHHIHIRANEAVVALSRINDLNGEEMKLSCSIDLVFESGRWQVLREEIFLRPLSS